MTGGPPGDGSKAPQRPLPKRFYKAVTVAAMASPPLGGEGLGVGGTPSADVRRSAWFHVLLDGKPVRTPAKRELAVPTQGLAEAIAAEWESQVGHIDPASMPLTRLANSAIDGVAGREAEVRADIVKYAGSDLVCYRAEAPQDLVHRQGEAWDPLLVWGRHALAAPFAVATGVMPADQPAAATSAIAKALNGFDAFGLAALHVMTTLTGSALLALAHAHGRLSAEAAWAAAHVDEDWQIGRWGEDADATARRAQRWTDMQTASRLLALTRKA